MARARPGGLRSRYRSDSTAHSKDIDVFSSQISRAWLRLFKSRRRQRDRQACRPRRSPPPGIAAPRPSPGRCSALIEHLISPIGRWTVPRLIGWGYLQRPSDDRCVSPGHRQPSCRDHHDQDAADAAHCHCLHPNALLRLKIEDPGFSRLLL